MEDMKDILKNIRDNVAFPFKDEDDQIEFFDSLQKRDKENNIQKEMNLGKKEKDYDDSGRYNTFYLTFKTKDISIDTDFCELLVKKIFDRYKIGLVKTPPYLSVIGYTKTRKRIQTIERAIHVNIAVFIKENVISESLVQKYLVSIEKLKLKN